MRRLLGFAALALVGACFGAPATAAAADAYEPNDTSQQATGPLVGGVRYTADIDELNDADRGAVEDVDWYTFYVSRPVRLTVTYFSELKASNCFGPEARLMDLNGSTLASAQPPKGKSETMAYDVPRAGSYRLRFKAYTIEPCAPPDSRYSFVVGPSNAITTPPRPTPPVADGDPSDITPGTAGGTGDTTGTTGGLSGTTTGTVAGPGGAGTDVAGTGTRLASPALAVTTATLRGGALRVVGTLARGAVGARVRVVVERTVGGRVVRLVLKARRISGNRWLASGRIPARLRGYARQRFRASYLGTTGFSAKRLRLMTVQAQ